MKIQVFGSGCAKCKTLHKEVERIAKEIGLNSEVEYSTDVIELTKLGVMSSPALVIDDKVVAAGKIPSEKELKKILLNGESKNEIEEPKNCNCKCC